MNIFPTEFEFVTQICTNSKADDAQLEWLPVLSDACTENGLIVSENLYIIVSD